MEPERGCTVRRGLAIVFLPRGGDRRRQGAGVYIGKGVRPGKNLRKTGSPNKSGNYNSLIKKKLSNSSTDEWWRAVLGKMFVFCGFFVILSIFLLILLWRGCNL